MQNNGNYAVHLPFKVTDFGTNPKSIYDFLLLINTNVHPILYHFQVIVYYWSHLRFRQGVGYLSLTQSFWMNPETQDHEIWPQETLNIALMV